MSVNKVILLGNVGQEPEIRYIDNNRAVANFSLATTERGFKTQDGKTIPDRTEWHRIVVWGNQAKIIENYVHKGSSLYVEGKIQSRTWKDKDGNDRYTVEIMADSIQLVGGRRSDETTGGQPQQNSQQPTTTAAPQVAPQQSQDDELNDIFGEPGMDNTF